MKDDKSHRGYSPESESGRFTILQPTTSHTSASMQTLGQKAAAAKNAKRSSSTGPATTKKSTAQLGLSSSMDSGAKNANAGDDYMREYLKKKAMLEKERQTQKGAPDPMIARKKAEEETLLRVRARGLRDQINMWQREHEFGNYDTLMINGMISQLEQELNSIDSRYWP